MSSSLLPTIEVDLRDELIQLKGSIIKRVEGIECREAALEHEKIFA